MLPFTRHNYSELAAKPEQPFSVRVYTRPEDVKRDFSEVNTGYLAALAALTALSKPGRKDDNDKPRMDLLPFAALEGVAKVLTFGARKYGDDNWRDVTPFRSRYLAAALRHLAAYGRGEVLDPETKLPHLAHAACCLLFLLEGPRQKIYGRRCDTIVSDDVLSDIACRCDPSPSLEIARDVARTVRAVVAATARESRKSRPKSRRAALPGSRSKRQSQPRR